MNSDYLFRQLWAGIIGPRSGNCRQTFVAKTRHTRLPALHAGVKTCRPPVQLLMPVDHSNYREHPQTPSNLLPRIFPKTYVFKTAVSLESRRHCEAECLARLPEQKTRRVGVLRQVIRIVSGLR